MINKPKVTIVCTVYKHEAYLQECLHGFVMQKTDFPFEILVNDDCSPDGSAAIIREYEQKYPNIFRCIYQKENQYSKGIMPWSFLFPMANGEYIAICEGDDFWTDPYKLQKQVDFMDANTEYVACFHNSKVKYPNTCRFFNSANEVSNPTTEDIICRKWFISTNSLLFRNIPIPYPEWSIEKVINEDYMIELFLAREGKFYYMDDIMAIYRQDGTGVSAELNSNKVCMYDHLIYLLTHMKDEYNGKYSDAFDKSIANYEAQKNDVIKSTHPVKKWFYRKTYTRAVKRWLRKIV